MRYVLKPSRMQIERWQKHLNNPDKQVGTCFCPLTSALLQLLGKPASSVANDWVYSYLENAEVQTGIIPHIVGTTFFSPRDREAAKLFIQQVDNTNSYEELVANLGTDNFEFVYDSCPA